MQLSEHETRELERLVTRYNISLLVMFGSHAKNKARADSDLDLAVKFRDFEDNVSTELYLAVYPGLQKVFGRYKLDLAFLNHADPLFHNQIMSSAILICGDSGLFCQEKILAYKRFQDHKRFLEMEQDYVKRFVARHRQAS